MIDCDKFDTWYYGNCGGDDWWATVGKIIEKAAGHDLANDFVFVSQDDTPAHLPQTDEHGGNVAQPVPEDASVDTVETSEKQQAMTQLGDDVGDGEVSVSDVSATTQPFSIYVQNIHTGRYSETAIPFPADPAELRSFLDSMGIIDWQDIKNVEVSTPDYSDLSQLTNKLNDMLYDTEMTPHTLNELNYLAVRVGGLDGYGQEIFLANIEAGRNCGSVAEIINLTFKENINRFDVQPAHAPEQYGDFLLEAFYQDVHADAFNRLKDSGNEQNKDLAAYIEKLE